MFHDEQYLWHGLELTGLDHGYGPQDEQKVSNVQLEIKPWSHNARAGLFEAGLAQVN